jgi:chromate transporter
MAAVYISETKLFMKPTETGKKQSNRLAEVASLFLRLGFTAFGGPAAHIAMMRQEIVQRRGWISDERFLDLLGIVNLIPGPNSTELAIYLGYVRAGWPGLLLAGICFIGPAMLIVLAFAWLYVRYGTLPQAGWLFYGIKPVVIAIVAQALWGLLRTVLKSVLPALLIVAVLVLYLLGVNELLLLFGGGIVYGCVRWLRARNKGNVVLHGVLPFTLSMADLRDLWRTMPISPVFAGVVAVVVPVSLLTLFLTFLKIGATLYGSGYVLLAFLRGDLVDRLHWLTDRQLLDAVSIGQFTPGPVFTTATFIGYVIAGLPGALLATLGIFLPSFAFVAIIHPLATRLRRSPWTAPILDGVNAAAVALMGGVLIELGRSALIDVLTWALAIVALAILLRFKMNSVWLILAGALVGVVRFWLF